MKIENILKDSEIQSLRSAGIISNTEVALMVGDLIIAENVVTRERRVVNEAKSHLSESKILLKG